MTGLLVAWGRGDETVDGRLISAVYDDLKRVAHRRLRAERPDHTLTPTALVHEAYLRLVDLKRVRWQNRAQFYAIAAGAVRRILVNHARGRAAVKRGASGCRVTLADDAAQAEPRDVELLDLDDALTRLGIRGPWSRRPRDGAVLRRSDNRGVRRSAGVVAGNHQAGLDARPCLAAPRAPADYRRRGTQQGAVGSAAESCVMGCQSVGECVRHLRRRSGAADKRASSLPRRRVRGRPIASRRSGVLARRT